MFHRVRGPVARSRSPTRGSCSPVARGARAAPGRRAGDRRDRPEPGRRGRGPLLSRSRPATPSRSSWPFRAHVRLAGVLKRAGERLCFRRNRLATFVCVSEGVAEEIRDASRRSPRARLRSTTASTRSFAPGAPRGGRGVARGARSRRSGWSPLRRQRVGAQGSGRAIEALALAPEWDLLVAGGGEEGATRRSARARRWWAVHWLGVTHEVPVVYELADAFVVASSYETFSLVTFEAAASGLPILATPVNGVRELIEDGRNGYLIVPDPAIAGACASSPRPGAAGALGPGGPALRAGVRLRADGRRAPRALRTARLRRAGGPLPIRLRLRRRSAAFRRGSPVPARRASRRSSGSVAAGTVNSRSTASRPARASRRRSSGSSRSSLSRPASAALSPSGNTSPPPVRPTSQGISPESEPTTGTPHQSASTITRPNCSFQVASCARAARARRAARSRGHLVVG